MSDTILRLPEVVKRTGLSRSMLYVMLDEGTFPTRVPLGKRAIGFSAKAVDEWIERKIKKAAAQ